MLILAFPQVVQFIRLCLLAVKGGLTSTQEKEMIYETDDEIRYRINQNVRHLLSLSDQTMGSSGVSSTGKGTAEGVVGASDTVTAIQLNQDQARRSVLTFFRLIHVVIFARCQPSWDCEFIIPSLHNLQYLFRL